MNTFISNLFYFLICILLLSSCSGDGGISNNLPDTTITENGVHVVVEIPAGTNKNQEEDDDQIIDFLPYPGNYGYVHSTMIDGENEADGHPLAVLVIAENLKKGTHLEVIPIAALVLKDNGALTTKIIAVPSNRDLQVIDAEDFSTFFMKYNGAFQIIEKWFLNYKGLAKVEMVNWADEKKAMAEIIKWQVEKEE